MPGSREFFHILNQKMGPRRINLFAMNRDLQSDGDIRIFTPFFFWMYALWRRLNYNAMKISACHDVYLFHTIIYGTEHWMKCSSLIHLGALSQSIFIGGFYKKTMTQRHIRTFLYSFGKKRGKCRIGNFFASFFGYAYFG